MADENRTSKHAQRGPMKVVYAVIVIGLVVIIGTALFTGQSPRDENSPPVASQGQ